MKIIQKRSAALLHGFVFISSTNTTKRMSKQQQGWLNKIAKIWNQERPRKEKTSRKKIAIAHEMYDVLAFSFWY